MSYLEFWMVLRATTHLPSYRQRILAFAVWSDAGMSTILHQATVRKESWKGKRYSETPTNMEDLAAFVNARRC